MAQTVPVMHEIIKQMLLEEIEHYPNFKASNNRTTDSTKSVDNRTADPHNRKVIA